MKIRKRECKHGVFVFGAEDQFVGKSLDVYGDYSEDEISVFKMILRPNDVAIEVGSNIGALTVPMSKLCKKVYAFEPQPDNFRLLEANIQSNNATNIHAYPYAVGSDSGVVNVPELEDLGHTNYGRVEIIEEPKANAIAVTLVTLDQVIDIEDKIKFIKIDVEGYEREVLEGAKTIIMKDRPLLYVENDREEKSAELVGWLLDHGYRCFWHRSPLFYPGNFRGQSTNIFGNIHSHNMVCFPEETKTQISNLEELDDKRVHPLMYEQNQARLLKRLELHPEDLETRFIAAHYTNLMNDTEGALKLIEENLRYDANHTGSRAIKGVIDLQRGNFKDGWEGYELRYSQINKEGFGYRPHYGLKWDGQPTEDTVLIWSEQGFGDTIMFCRFMREVLELAPNAILEVPNVLYELIEYSGIVPEGSLFRLGRSLPTYKYHLAIPSIPATLKLHSEEQLKRDTYLFAEANMIDTWKAKKFPRIGVCHKGGVASERSYSRDIPFNYIEDLAKDYGPFVTLTHEGQWDTYMDTAAAISCLDLVLTVDTSVAHLSGALGVPTYLMLSSDPDFRWMKDRSDSPWYPSMKIFRQKKFMDWSTVIEDIRSHLETRIQKAAE
jgi:FkbM family methyltransferase